jgi:surface antigen
MNRNIAGRTAAASLAASILLAGCSNTVGTKQGIGTLGGAALGGLAGSQIGGGSGKLAAVAVGTLLGAVVGNQVGQSLDRADEIYMSQAASRAYSAPVGEVVTWQNPSSNNPGSITTHSQRYEPSVGRYCREYQQTVVVGGRTERAYGTACRNPDGSWSIAN